MAELGIDGKDAMVVRDINEFKGHGGSAVHGIFNSTERTEMAVAAERDKFELPAGRTAVHDPAKGRIPAVDRLIDIFDLSFSGVESKHNFFIMVFKNSL